MSKKSMVIAGCSIIGVLVLLILIVWLLSAFKKNYLTYEKVEEKMVAAAEKYYKTYPELLPVDEGKYTLQYSALVEGQFIKPLNELLKDGDSCTAEVNVYKNNIGYDYIPKLDCGIVYKTYELYQKIINDHPVTTTGSGLYQSEDGSYYFRGKVTDNYVKLGSTGSGKKKKDILWRILSIDSHGNIQIKSTVSFTDRVVYDSRYNINMSKTTGYNDFEGSMLKDFLIKMNNEELLLTNEEKQKLITQELCTGKRKTTDIINDGSIECNTKSAPMYFGTITPYEYIRASLDTNCAKVSDRSCGNFNYLHNTDSISEWTITGAEDNTYQVYSFNGEIFELSRANISKRVFPTAYISSRNLFKSGSGTKDDPYILIVEKTSSTTKKK